MSYLKPFYCRFIGAIIFFASFTAQVHAQLYINEFSASNTSGIQDPDFTQDADWIEIYNSGTLAVNLQGYYLSDNISKPNKWRITATTIAAKGFVVFWADGKDTLQHTNFKLGAASEEIGLFDSKLNKLDSVHYSLQKPNISYGRNIQNLQQWGFFLNPTPGGANNAAFYTDLVLNVPEYKPMGGIFASGLYVDLFNDLGGDIRYTLDGSEPTIDSKKYAAKLQISATTVVRARVFKPNMVPGPIVTNTYFIDNNNSNHNLPVVSLATNDENFWDSQKGIYVQDFKPDWEVPVNIELFENNGSDRAAFNELSGIKINGLYSWQLPQKMLGVYFKKQYGAGSLGYPIFNTTKRASFKTFALRASGNDWSNTLMRDILGQNATLLNMKLDISAYRWCVVYVNGKYLGIHNFREKIETDYIEKHYGIDGGTFDLIENEDYAEAGSLDAYNHLIKLYNKDLSVQSNYDSVASYIDIESFTEMVITEIASGNTSIDHNVMAWKPKTYGKWRWILMDFDRGFYIKYLQNGIDFLTSQQVVPFRQLMANAGYKKYFGKQLADHFFTSFNPNQMHNLINEHKNTLAGEIPKHVERWLGTTSSYGNAMPSVNYWYNEIAQLKRYTQERPGIVLKDLQNYGFSAEAQLTLSNVPGNGGSITFNNLIVPNADWTGIYPMNLAANVVAEAKAGFTFLGWVTTVKKDAIKIGDTWKYNDSGTEMNSSWTDSTFNDAAWKTGTAQFGYGEGDEQTVVDYGNASNRNITSYFRKSFNLSNTDMNATNAVVKLLADDGAIVYINGTELIRENLGDFATTYQTLTATAISSASEGKYNIYAIDPKVLHAGTNTVAVEVHQETNTSSDMSFDLELAIYHNDNLGYISTSKNLNITLTGDKSVAAIYASDGKCMVPAVIAENTTLHKDCSPYVVQDDVVIEKNATLTIEPGVDILFSKNSNVYIHGNIIALGTPTDSIRFKINPNAGNTSWGALNFEYTTDTSYFKYVSVANASKGPVPIRVGAISGFYTNLVLDHINISNTNGNPIAARYSDVRLTNSYIHSKVVSDLINIKYGKAYIDRCEFRGNPLDDADGIDYDGIVNGTIKNTKIIDILGFNADAVDIGEETTNVMIDSVLILNSFDKGVSVGQRSSVILTNSTLINCNMGLGIKDSSRATINHCTFYGNNINVNCYEKNPGRSGGNAVVRNSILSNTSDATVKADKRSTMSVKYSWSDNDSLPEGENNMFGNPLFTDPLHFDFTLQNASPCIAAASDNKNEGAYVQKIKYEPEVYICRFFINAANAFYPEFIALYNPTDHPVDASGYSIDKGVTVTIPAGTIIAAGDTLFITDFLNHSAWWNNNRLIKWEDGKLSNNGESIELRNNYGIVIDHIKYNNDGAWPMDAFTNNAVFSLVNDNADNHFPENWTSIDVDKVLDIQPVAAAKGSMRVYPNPCRDYVTIETSKAENQYLEIYNLMGEKLKTQQLRNYKTTVDVKQFNQPIVLIRIGTDVLKVVVLK